MAISQESFNQNLYDLLRSRGYEPTPIDSKGQASPVPATADVFKFKFNKDPVWVTIDDASNLKVYYDDTVMDKDDDVRENESFSDFLQTLKKWCMRRQLGFELSNRNHLHADMAQREHTKQKEALGEGYHPINRKASYNDSIPTVKVILQHSKQLSETDKRYHNIEKIFVENTNGERFLLPTRRPGIAKVYARHVAEGGTPYDERGSHITSLVEEYTKMAGFVRAVRNGQFNESANSLINEGINHYNNLRETLSRMISQRGYNNYFESYTPVLNEEQIEESNINELFTKSTLDPRIKNVLPILNKLNKNITEVKEANELEEWADKIVEGEVVQLTPSDDGLMGDFIGKDVGVAKPTVSNVKEKYVSRYGDEWETYLLADLLEFLRKKDYPLKLRAKKAHEMLNKIDPTVHADMPYGQFKEATDLKSIPESELDEINLNILKKKPSPEERAAKAYDAARMPSTKDKFKQAYTQMRKDMGLDDNAKTKELVGEEGVAEGEGDDAYVACIVQHNRSGQAMVQRTKPISRDRAEEVIKNALAKSTFVHPPFMTIYPASAGKLDGSTIMAKYPDMSQQGVAKGSQLDEFAPGQGGNGDDGMGYLHALAQAWYTHDLSRLADIARKGGSPIKKIIDAQEAVEKILSRGVHCPDGKVRKYYIDYTADFDGVDMVSHDYYEHSDYGPNDEYVDGRTGKPWSAYDHIEFSDDQLDEGVAEGSLNESDKFTSWYDWKDQAKSSG